MLPTQSPFPSHSAHLSWCVGISGQLSKKPPTRATSLLALPQNLIKAYKSTWALQRARARMHSGWHNTYNSTLCMCSVYFCVVGVVLFSRCGRIQWHAEAAAGYSFKLQINLICLTCPLNLKALARARRLSSWCARGAFCVLFGRKGGARCRERSAHPENTNITNYARTHAKSVSFVSLFGKCARAFARSSRALFTLRHAAEAPTINS